MEVMKKVILNVGMALLAMGLLTACSSGNDVVEVPDQPKQEQPKPDNPKEDEPENPDPEDSMVVDMLPQTRAIQLTEEQREFAKKNNDFTFNLYRAVNDAQQERKSIVTSPLSVTYVMGMLNDGAAGKTEEEITSVLGFGAGDKAAVNAYCQALIQQAPLADPSVKLQIANIVAADEDVVLEDTYKQNMSDYYEADVASLDFSEPASLDYLNGWCNEKTEGMIPKIIDELSPEAKLVLMNAICFKATWTEKFDEQDTKEETFTKADGTAATVPMMYRNALIQYGANDVFSSVCLPFGSGDKYRMYVLLPSEGKSVDDVVNVLTNDFWEKNRPSGNAVVDLKLPRFKTNSDIRLNDLISQLGAPSMFDSEKADFAGISKNYKELYVSLLKQKAAIEVSEEGTKASAVTVAMLDTTSGPMDYEKATFHADRPFVYLIQEWDTRAVFFIGTYEGDL
jgi:serpin B